MIQALLEIFDLHFKRSRVQNPGANSQLIGNPPYFWNPWIHSICTIRPQSISFFKGQIRRSVNLFTALLKSTLIFLSQNQQLWAAWEGGGGARVMWASRLHRVPISTNSSTPSSAPPLLVVPTFLLSIAKNYTDNVPKICCTVFLCSCHLKIPKSHPLFSLLEEVPPPPTPTSPRFSLHPTSLSTYLHCCLVMC